MKGKAVKLRYYFFLGVAVLSVLTLGVSIWAPPVEVGVSNLTLLAFLGAVVFLEWARRMKRSIG